MLTRKARKAAAGRPSVKNVTERAADKNQKDADIEQRTCNADTQPTLAPAQPVQGPTAWDVIELLLRLPDDTLERRTNHRIEVSTRIKEEWFNGKAYYRLHGERLSSLPAGPNLRPASAFLDWHNENVFVA